MLARMRPRLPQNLPARLEQYSREIAEALAKIEAAMEPMRQAVARAEATGREFVRRWTAAGDRILDEEARRRGVSRGRALEWDLLVELRGWNKKTLREVLRSHRRPGGRRAGDATYAVMFAEVDRVMKKNRKLSLTAATKRVAEKHGASAQGLYRRYKKSL